MVTYLINTVGAYPDTSFGQAKYPINSVSLKGPYRSLRGLLMDQLSQKNISQIT